MKIVLFITFYVFSVQSEEEVEFLDLTKSNVHSHKQVVVCYWGTWSHWRPEQGAFSYDNIDPSLCTHLIYSFAGLDNTTYTIKSLDPFLDTEEEWGKGLYRKVVGFKETNPHLKVSLAIGGWNEGSGKYSDMAMNPARRTAFINSALDFIKKYGFDGLDLDWEYPGSREGSRPEDKQNFALLIKELRTVFDRHNLLLTAAVGVPEKTVVKAYDIPALSKYLDYIHLMCYDFHGLWDKETGHNAPLRREREEDAGLSIHEVVGKFLEMGADRNKLVLGLPFYGRTFLLDDETSTGLNALAKPVIRGFQGRFTKEDGFMGYQEICMEQRESRGKWIEEFDTGSQVPILYSGKKWISYDNEKSLSLKAKYAYRLKLAGVMIWSIDTDDFRGACGSVRFPLLRSVNYALYRAEQDVENEIEDEVIKSDKSSATFSFLHWLLVPTIFAFILA